MGGGGCHEVIAEGDVWLSGGPEGFRGDAFCALWAVHDCEVCYRAISPQRRGARAIKRMQRTP